MKNKEVNKTLYAQTGKNLLELVKNKEKSAQKQQKPAFSGATEAEVYTIWENLLGHVDFGVHDDFFKVGGNSLKAVQLLSRISSHFLVQISLTDIFLQPTIAQIAILISGKQNGNPALSSITKVKERPEHIPLSFGQERLWFIDQLKGTVEYHVPTILRLTGNLNRKGLAYALQTLIERHESLRSVIYQEQGNVYQKVIEAQQWELLLVDGAEFENDSENLKQYCRKFINKPFDLSRDYMLRAALIHLQEHDHILIVSMHHIASDGWSIPIIVKEVVELYESYVEGRPSKLAPLALQYADYAIWQRNYQPEDVLNNQLDYWKVKLLDTPVLQFPTDFARPFVQSTRGASAGFKINKELPDQIQLLSYQQGTTLFMTLLAAFKVLLYRYSNQQDIVVGTPVAGRQHKEIEGLVGYFVNTLALRTEIKEEDSFISFLARVKQTAIEAFEHQQAPFEKVVEAVVRDRDMSRSPLFQVMFVFQHAADKPELKLLEMNLSEEETVQNTSKFDISFLITETAEGLHGSVEYCTDLYKEETILRITDHYKELLGCIVRTPDENIGLLSMINDAEMHRLLWEYNDTYVDYPQNKTLVDLFEEQVLKTPNNIAVVFEKQELTYRQLHERSNRLAHYLQSKGVKEEFLVPVCLDRSLEMLVGILSILKAGGAYVPIDPAYPEDRIRFMLEDTSAAIVLSDNNSISKLAMIKGIEVISIDGEWPLISQQPLTGVQTNLTSDNLAYVMYTSGSTGKPKGVMNEHGAVMNRLYWAQDYFSLTVEDAVLQKTTFSFDVSVWELLWPLQVGSRLVLAKPEGQKDPDYLKRIIELQNITVVHFVPSMLRIFLSNLLQGECKGLKKVLCSGESLDPLLVELFTRKLPEAELHNLYGPTEAAIEVTCWSLTGTKEELSIIPIGKPIANTHIYILDKGNHLVPLGGKGEICIGGIPPGRGYLNLPDLTAGNFISDPFSQQKGGRIYKTGDLGRWLPDGNIEYLGRMDNQVKIRGYRVELGEIEHALLQSELVKEAVVLAREDSNGTKRLVGYVIAKDEYTKDGVTAYLRGRLPEYMVPQLWVELKKLPLTSSGKTDRKALPDVDVNDLFMSEYVAPHNKLEKQLAGIWQQLIGVEQIGIHDNFFELGGHSLLATRVIAAIRKQLEIELVVNAIFDYPTIALLAEQINIQSPGNILPSITRIQPRPELIPLSFGQERLWFIDRLEGSTQYHTPAVLRLKGNLNREALVYSLKTIVIRHEAVRTVFMEKDGQAYQTVQSADKWCMSFIEGSSYKENQIELKELIHQLVNKPFDLSMDYMLRADLIILSLYEYVLIVTMHHIASDGWSRSVLVKEVIDLYKSYEEGSASSLKPLPVQYADYAIWQRQYISGEVLEKELSYWKEKLNGVTTLQLPTDYTRSTIQSARGASISFDIDKSLSLPLQQLSYQQGVTLFMTLLSAFNVLMYRYSAQHDICVGSPVAGRKQQELEDLIGFFVNTVIYKTEVKDDISFFELLQQVRHTAIEALKNQDVPFEKVVDAVITERSLSMSPLAQVMFVFLNTPEIPKLIIGDVQFSEEDYEHTTSSFDITFFIYETPDGLTGSVEYSTDLFHEHTIKSMITHYKELLNSVVKTPEQLIGKLPMLSTTERQQLLVEFNDTHVDDKNSDSIVALFEKQVLKTPDAVAVVYGEEKFTYQQLNAKINQLAYHLRSKAVKEEALVPICIEQGVNMIISILAVLKAGGAYVPIDPAYPADRISYMLEDTGASVVISNKANKSKLPLPATFDIIEMDSDLITISQYSSDNLQATVRESQLAYIIYTSGSTGKPKGVMIEHRSLLNYLLNNKTRYVDPLKEYSGSYIHLSYSFDASLTAIFMPLLSGKPVVIGTKQSVDVFEDSNLLSYGPYDFIKITPSHLELLLPKFKAFGKGLLTKKLVIGGEALYPGQFDSFTAEGIDVEVINEYGPTEATVGCTTYNFYTRREKDKIKDTVSIGKPIDNVVIYIVDNSNNLVAAGVRGEICIAGSGLARGYLNLDGLTAEKFISNPFSDKSGDRMYKTGDMGCWLPDGNIRYMGRVDDQVKVRGYRIELGEIEHVLQHCEAVSQGVVLLREEDKEMDKRLVSYYVPEFTAVKSKERELYHQRITNWKELYETEYSQTERDENIDPEFNIIGWNDSFTGQAIPEEHMKEWLNDIVAVIFSQRPERVLEIGCGTGLIYFQLAGKVNKYIGSDLSASSINQIKQRISKGLRNYGETELFTAPAHEAGLQVDQAVDTILLNSIVQYFPGVDYMNTVIEQCIALIKDKGRIIIGDVRDNRLLELFKCRLRIQKSRDSMHVKEFKWSLEQDLIKEEELCFSPGYFYTLKDLYPQITHIEIRWKNAAYINELSLYRYTVVIYVGIEKNVVIPQWESWDDVSDIKHVFPDNGPGENIVALKAVPNPRIWKERLLQQALQNTLFRTVGEIMRAVETEDQDTRKIYQLIQLAESKGYRHTFFVHEDPLKINLLFESHPSDGFIQQPVGKNVQHLSDSHTNLPLFTDIGFLMQKDIRELLLKSLPDYMVPSEFNALRQLPLTSSGKVDRLFLSQREDRIYVNALNYLPPGTDLEKKLAKIWKELLHIERIGIEDDFFNLGGHSLLAMRVISAIRKELEIELNIKELFVYPTIALLAGHIQKLRKGLLLPSIEVTYPRPDRIPLSFSQERLWFIDQLGGSLQYHIPSVLRLKGNLNIAALSDSLQQIINRHEVLRTVIYEEKGQGYQLIKEKDGWELTVVDGSKYREDAEGLQLYVKQLNGMPFDLSKDYMLRASLIKLKDQDHVLVATLHHIASDGWSASIMVSELVRLYNASVEWQETALAPLSLQYADYAIWQRTYLQGESWNKKLTYWKDKLEGVAILQLPADFQRPIVRSAHGAIVDFKIDRELADQLKSLSQQQGATLFMTLLASFNILLYRYSGQQDICIGTPIAGRQQQEVEKLIGFFVNTLALRSEVNDNASFLELLQQVKSTTLEAYEHQEVPFEKVVELTVRERDMSRSPLFQVMLVLQNTPDIPTFNLRDVQLLPEKYEYGVSTFDITLLVKETAEGLNCVFEYSSDLYAKQTIMRMADHFVLLLKSLIKEPEQSIGSLMMLSRREEQQLLVEFNDTRADYPADKTIVELFEQQVQKTPGSVALVYEDRQLTYTELNERSNQLARYLSSKGVGQETMVPLCIEHGIEMIIAILGILKAGGAYVPIDPSYPQDRISFMLQDVAASVVVSSEQSRAKLAVSTSVTLIDIIKDGELIDEHEVGNLGVNASPDNLAYVIYTSGSTGKPKGVMIEHGSVVNLIKAQSEFFGIDPEERILQFSNYCFDASVEQIFLALFNGASLVLLPEGVQLNLKLFERFLREERISHLHATPSFLENVHLVDHSSLKRVIAGGEACKKELSSRWRNKVDFYNEYGPTETTVTAIEYSDDNNFERINSIPIGRPLSNTQAYVLNREGALCPIGVPGEICIGGVQVARGYVNRPELTAERFVSDPFSKQPGARMYKTGDIGRWLEDGNIEYLGRKDDQVKIRGYRIELGEIENVLLQSGLVNQAVVQAKQDKEGNQRLVGYLVAEGTFNKEAILSYLRGKLPEYMIPVLWVDMEYLPLNNNGKVDKKNLPDPDTRVFLKTEYVAPRTEMEEKLVEIWQDLLQVKLVGIHDNFFELGGHSLLVMSMVAYIETELLVSIPIKVLFQFTTINDLSKYLQTQTNGHHTKSEKPFKLYEV